MGASHSCVRVRGRQMYQECSGEHRRRQRLAAFSQHSVPAAAGTDPSTVGMHKHAHTGKKHAGLFRPPQWLPDDPLPVLLE